MPSMAEITAVFKLINSPDNKKILDDNKGDIQRAVSGIAQSINKTMGADVFRGASESFKKKNPDLFSGGGAGVPPEEPKKTTKLSSLERDLTAIITKIGITLGVPVTGLGRLGVAGVALAGSFFALKKSVEETLKAYDDARKLYAKSLLTGLSVGFNAKRGMLSEVLGVSETEVMRFGAAMAYLTPKLAFATDQITRTTIPLTGVGWEFKILGENVKALWAQIASALAPAFKQFASELNDFIVTLGKSEFLKAAAQEVGVIMIALNDVLGAVEIVVNSFTVGMKVIADSIAIMIMKTLNLLSKIPGLSKLGGWDTSKAMADIIGSTTALSDEIKNYFKNFFGAKTNNIPPPLSQMKQLPAGAFEKMGLIIGGGMADKALEYQRRTATGIEKLVGAIQGSRQTRTFYMNRNPYVNGH